MEIEDYKSNSFKSKEGNRLPEKKIEKAISGTAKTKKKSEIQKFTDVFVSEDIGSVKNYIFTEVLVPTIKKGISDIVTNGVDMLLYGESRKSSKNRYSEKVSYRQERDYDRRDDRRRSVYASPQGFDYDEIVFETKGDAEAVLERLNDIIDQYNVASLLDLYDIAGLSCDNYNADKYGWVDIRTAKSVRVRDGYVLKLPKALPINKL